MQVIYENNFKKFKNLFKKNKVRVQDVLRYPYSELTPVHLHTRDFLSLWSERYASPLNHVNLYDIIKLKQVSDLPYILVRDGLATLIDFFIRFPFPNKLEPMLIINNIYSPYIPPAWKEKVIFFQFEVPLPSMQVTNRDTLIVKGQVLLDIFDFDFFKRQIEKAVSESNFKIIILCLQHRHNYFIEKTWQGDEDFTDFSNTALRYVYDKLGINHEVELISPKKLYLGPTYNNAYFIDCSNKNGIYIDDYLDYFLLSKGAAPIHTKKATEVKNEDLVVSLNHLYNIRIFSSLVSYSPNLWEKINQDLSLLGIEDGEKLNEEGFRYLFEFSKFNLNCNNYFILNP